MSFEFWGLQPNTTACPWCAAPVRQARRQRRPGTFAGDAASYDTLHLEPHKRVVLVSGQNYGLEEQHTWVVHHCQGTR